MSELKVAGALYAYLPVLVAREVASGEPAFRVYDQGVLTVGKQRN